MKIMLKILHFIFVIVLCIPQASCAMQSNQTMLAKLNTLNNFQQLVNHKSQLANQIAMLSVMSQLSQNTNVTTTLNQEQSKMVALNQQISTQQTQMASELTTYFRNGPSYAALTIPLSLFINIVTPNYRRAKMIANLLGLVGAAYLGFCNNGSVNNYLNNFTTTSTATLASNQDMLIKEYNDYINKPVSKNMALTSGYFAGAMLGSGLRWGIDKIIGRHIENRVKWLLSQLPMLKK